MLYIKSCPLILPIYLANRRTKEGRLPFTLVSVNGDRIGPVFWGEVTGTCPSIVG